MNLNDTEAQAVLDAFSYRCLTCGRTMALYVPHDQLLFATNSTSSMDLFMCNDGCEHLYYRYELERS